MLKIITGSLATGGRIETDTWQELGDIASLESCAPQADILVPLALWLLHAGVLGARGGRNGVLLSGTDDPRELEATLGQLALVAIAFPAFTDGRGYSIARLLRERLGFRGEVRAVGDVLRDQIFYMLRCGFDSFALRADKDPEEALSAYQDFSESYQAAVDEPSPLYRRRLFGVLSTDRASS